MRTPWIACALAVALPKTTDRITRLHLEDVRDQIAKALGGKAGEDAERTSATTDGLLDPFGGWILDCWKADRDW